LLIGVTSITPAKKVIWDSCCWMGLLRNNTLQKLCLVSTMWLNGAFIVHVYMKFAL